MRALPDGNDGLSAAARSKSALRRGFVAPRQRNVAKATEDGR